jgi:hypothetical protein
VFFINNDNDNHMLVMINKDSLDQRTPAGGAITSTNNLMDAGNDDDTKHYTGFMCDLGAFATIDDLINRTSSSSSSTGVSPPTSSTSTSSPDSGISSLLSPLPLQWIPLPALPNVESKKDGQHEYRFTECFMFPSPRY